MRHPPGDIQGDEAELCAMAGSCAGFTFSTGDGITVADFTCSPPYCAIESMTPGQAQIQGWVDSPNVFVFQVRSQNYTYANTLENQEVLQQSTTTTVTELGQGTNPASVVYRKEVDNTLRFSTAAGHEGEFISGEQRTNSRETMRFDIDVAARAAVGGATFERGQRDAIPSATTRFLNRHIDKRAATRDILIDGALCFTPFPEGYEGMKLVFEGAAFVHTIFDSVH